MEHEIRKTVSNKSLTGRAQEKEPDLERSPDEIESEEFKQKEEQLKLEAQKKLEEKKAEREEQEKKLTTTLIRSSIDDKIICLALDGYETAENAFNIVIKEFLPRLNGTLICPYIFNSKRDEYYNWRQQKEYVIEKFRTRLMPISSKPIGNFIIQDTDPKCSHPIEQISKIAVSNKSEFVFLGYNGLKTGNYQPENIAIGLDYLLLNSNYPIVLFKDKNLRGVKNAGYKWLVIIEKENTNALRAVDYYLPLIDLSKDVIFGFGLLPKTTKVDAPDELKTQFFEKMKAIGISEEQTLYESVIVTNSNSEALREFVNQNSEHYFDYVIFNSNPDKYRIEKKNSEYLKYIEKVNANIGFVNGVYYEIRKLKDDAEKSEAAKKKGKK